MAELAGLAILALGGGALMSWWRAQRRRRQIISQARRQALHLVESARDQSLQILAEARISAEATKSKLNEAVDKISAEQLRKFQNLLTTISKDIESDALKEISVYRDRRQQEIEIEIDKLEQQRLQEIEAKITQAVADVVKRVTGQAIPMTEHERLILASLDEAKKRLGL